VRAVCQRVSQACVRVDGVVTGEIATGVVVLLGVARGDSAADVARAAGKVARLRVFADERGKFDRSVLDIGGAALVVSQFTLIADTRKGNRPSFVDAAPPDVAEALYERFCGMTVELVNDGPVTIVLEA
jgi:D-tyrosyl-tRNA(Tyr) deacylase